MPSSGSYLANGTGCFALTKKKKKRLILHQNKIQITQSRHFPHEGIVFWPGQERERLCGHILREPEPIRYKTLLSLQMQLNAKRFRHIIYMALAAARKTKPPEASSWQARAVSVTYSFVWRRMVEEDLSSISISAVGVSVSEHRLSMRVHLKLQVAISHTVFCASLLSLGFLPDSL